MKALFAPLSIVQQVALLMLLSGILGIGGMSLSLWMAQSMQGNAHAINKAGSLRMQSYRLLSRVPLDQSSDPLLAELERDQLSDDLRQPVKREGLTPQYLDLRDHWHGTLKPLLLRAQRPADAARGVAEFVRRLDALVSDLDRNTERRLALVALVQKIIIALTLLVLTGTILYLRRRLLRPWRHLLNQARAVSRGDFSQRYPLPAGAEPGGYHEMDQLGFTLNSMSQSLSQMYTELEQRIANSTADLRQKNRVLDFLYRASRQLHTGAPLPGRLRPVLEELQTLIPLREIQIRLYENDRDPGLDGVQADGEAASPDAGAIAIQGGMADTAGGTVPDDTARIAALPPAHDLVETGTEQLSWRLHDKLGQYGVMLAQYPPRHRLDDTQRRLVATLVEQLTSTLALERQAEHQQQLMLMAERTAIAGELHDSIAQSLSCLKLQIGVLQMQNTHAAPENQLLMQQMRDELNTAYRQLRELLTTFRLRQTEPGLRAALQTTVEEFSARLGFAVEFIYRLPAQAVSSHQAIHLTQIAREALTNIVKHAGASRVTLTADLEADALVLSIRDNGRGLPEEHQRQHHYGVVIMQDRARNLHGDCRVANLPGGGAEVRVTVPRQPASSY
ncbi:nitrate/nitrite two-component system sensor histidine kinase NarX [Sodalis sp. RH20]|uniref:nitrate/nitrite two-component system sensor histidine kinase NarX n=1 Tax=unclassified Sodalis (in: enterobacteria) TaxID=2636512 RepID=UPI0039B3E2A4